MRDDGTYTKYMGMEIEFYRMQGSTLFSLRSKDKKTLEKGFFEYAPGIFVKRDIPRSELGDCFKVRNFATCEGHESMFSGPNDKGLIWIQTDDLKFAEKYEHFLYDKGLYRVGVPMEKCTFREEIIPYTLPKE